MMNNIKSIISKLMIIAVTCAICIVSGVPVHAEDIEYICEVKMAIAKSGSDSDKNAAITDLESNGYTVLKATSTDDYETSGVAVNINAGTDKVPVYLGYKTTTDSKEAITNISMIEMAEEGDTSAAYSFTAYEEIVKQYKDNITTTLSSMKTGMAEFATNYDAGSPAAVWSYENLNRFYDPETGSAMGDVIIDFGRQVADGNEDSDLDSRMTDYYLKSNANFVSVLNSLVAVGCAEYQTDSTWIERFSEADPEGTYAGEGYDEAATAILNSWAGIYSIYKRYKEAGLTKDSTDEELQAYFETEADTMKTDVPYSLDTFSYARQSLQYMSQYEYNGKGMEEFFMQADSGDKLDKQTVLPLVASLTEGQRAMVAVLGVRGLFSILNNTKENWTGVEASVEMILNASGSDGSEKVSIYDGVNYSLYDSNGIALTSDAMVRQSSTAESPFGSSGPDTIVSTLCFIISGVCASLAVGTLTYTLMTVKNIEKGTDQAATFFKDLYNAKLDQFNQLQEEWSLATAGLEADSAAALKVSDEYMSKCNTLLDEMAAAKYDFEEATEVAKESLGVKAGGYGLTAIFAIMSIAASVYAAINYYKTIQNYYHPSYTQIPGIMIDNLKVENTTGIVTNYYVYYNTVMYNNDGTDEPADTNGFTGKKWNAMFTTTDKNAGAPIVASTFCAQIGKSEKENYTSVTKFHQSNAYNLNAHQFTDNANGIYLFYQDTDNPNLVVGSVFSAGTIGGILAGTAGGVVIGALGMMFVQKKKKKEAEA